MKKILASAVGALALAGALAAPAAAATDSGWLTYSACPYVDGCGIIATKAAHGAQAADGSCPGNVGVRIKYYPTGSGVKYSTTDWDVDTAFRGGQNTASYIVFH